MNECVHWGMGCFGFKEKGARHDDDDNNNLVAATSVTTAIMS